jgi:hypothetical protein
MLSMQLSSFNTDIAQDLAESVVDVVHGLAFLRPCSDGSVIRRLDNASITVRWFDVPMLSFEPVDRRDVGLSSSYRSNVSVGRGSATDILVSMGLVMSGHPLSNAS